MKITFYEESRIGGRKDNQDAYAHMINDDWSCFVVADGLGGQQRGEIASNEFCHAIMESIPTFAKNILNDSVNGLEELILSATKLMRLNIQQNYPSIDSHTTFALLWLDSQQLLTAHVGDSRIYRLNTEEVIWRTPDHTPVQELFERGKILEDDFSRHPQQNRLLRTVNIYEPPEADIYVHPPMQTGETILLCTDGFWNAVKFKDFLKLGQTKDIESTTKQMIDEILEEHPMDADNITVQVIREK